jgi:hypothetical protein
LSRNKGVYLAFLNLTFFPFTAWIGFLDFTGDGPVARLPRGRPCTGPG